uniref:Uncharacterized protein n=1 Tax=Arundo donax TaxID=35708 RepID=A0A0A9BTR1_ARUDO
MTNSSTTACASVPDGAVPKKCSCAVAPPNTTRSVRLASVDAST